MASHEPLKALLIVLTLILLVVTVIFATIAAVDNDSAIFDRGVGLDVGDEDDSRDTEVQPAAWTFQIWIVIYVWQFLWVFYTHTLICRKNESNKGYLYVRPSFLPSSFYGIFSLHLTVAVTWLFAYDNEYHVASFVGLSTMALTLYVCMFLAVYLLWLHEDSLSKSEMWANVLLVHNGLGTYAAWCTVAALLTLRTMLVETLDIKPKSAATVVLALILMLVVIYPSLEMWLSKRRLRYVWTPYFTLIVAVAGIIDSHKWDNDSDSANAILKIVIMSLLIIATITKVGISIFRSYRQPTKIDQLREAYSNYKATAYA